MPRSKRYQELKKLIDPKKLYAPAEAIELVKKTGSAKFDSTVECHVNLGIDVKKSEQSVRSTLVFPHSIGKTKRVAAFVTGEKEKDAKDAGADLVGGEELIDEIAKTQKIDFDVAVATPDMMPKLAKVAKILGPKGLMPNPKTETVSPNVKKMVEELKRGKVAFKNDATGNIHQAIGKASLDATSLLENFTILIDALKKNKPATAKGTFINSVTLTSTMGPGIKVDVSGI
ncbi:50S ribosomal protein L1 [Candidatus Uhrbacteria bacterium RIFCSPHIGHO2_12_FULL_60_25]|uniref:Large ribosomal subunit protein uL1 n=1 Tax=Candidatus Uhrbacteria bacterium RIFCSPHIGHO2_12_FULL_60_25 TaxID=1802399 RepID=A0A1F7UMZ8_9BACT|nr:MAG: 50S ribosomal protein L1 [Candidatus Uhrbacteria bacterium RIFCSPHIGHO2_02_FULL_60_44]OGL79671.1 MAG: 50S ribosomal protein L1 [Candidatus Uhrbacteria bacterium RIFCSPHIGHO2_12_FULL_60_25]